MSVAAGRRRWLRHRPRVAVHCSWHRRRERGRRAIAAGDGATLRSTGSSRRRLASQAASVASLATIRCSGSGLRAMRGVILRRWRARRGCQAVPAGSAGSREWEELDWTSFSSPAPPRGRARSSLDWRHWTAGSLALVSLFIVFTLLFNYVTLRYAAATQHPLLQAIVLADQRQEAIKTQQVVQGHLNAMAMRLGELQAQMLRLDGLGERLARLAGLKPQDMPALQPGTVPGRGGAESVAAVAAALGRRVHRARAEAVAPGRQPRRPAGASSRRCWSRTRPTGSSCPRCCRSSTAGIRRTSATGSIRSPERSRSTRASTFPPTRARRSSPRPAAR